MICNQLQNASEADFLDDTSRGECYELEVSSQCVCLIYCSHCGHTHSQEIPSGESAELLALSSEFEIRRRMWRRIHRERQELVDHLFAVPNQAGELAALAFIC